MCFCPLKNGQSPFVTAHTGGCVGLFFLHDRQDRPMAAMALFDLMLHCATDSAAECDRLRVYPSDSVTKMLKPCHNPAKKAHTPDNLFAHHRSCAQVQQQQDQYGR